MTTITNNISFERLNLWLQEDMKMNGIEEVVFETSAIKIDATILKIPSYNAINCYLLLHKCFSRKPIRFDFRPHYNSFKI